LILRGWRPTELKRLARNAAELMTLSAQLQAAGIQLELLSGPLARLPEEARACK